MNDSLVTFKTDKATKKQLKFFAEELGVNSSALINMVVKQALRERRVVLDTSLEPTPYLENIMLEAETDYADGRYITTVATEAELDDLFKTL